MRELTIVYEGLGISGKTTSIKAVANMLGATYRVDHPSYCRRSQLRPTRSR